MPKKDVKPPTGRCIEVLARTVCSYLRQRADLPTVTHIEDDQIRVNVIPQKLKDGENAALTTP